MTVVGESGLPHEAGRRDALHHRERVRKKITEQLKERIGEEDIIASGPEKRIRVQDRGEALTMKRNWARTGASHSRNSFACRAR